MPNTTNQKYSHATTTTLGEELYLIHLQLEREGQNRLAPSSVTKTTTLGEELWKVHCQRMQGYSEEDETDQNTNDNNHSQESSKRTLCLRNRTILL